MGVLAFIRIPAFSVLPIFADSHLAPHPLEVEDFFAEWTSQTFYDFFDNLADAMFYGMLTMAEPHAQGMLRVPAILMDMIPQLLFISRYYFPIAEEASRGKITNFLETMKIMKPMIQSMIPPAEGGN